MTETDPHFPTDTLRRVYAYLERIAGPDGRFSGGYNWHDLNAICGSRESYRAFFDLERLGCITTRIIPNSYGHQEFRLVRPPA